MQPPLPMRRPDLPPDPDPACPPGRRRRHHRHSVVGTALMTIGLLAVLLALARYVIIPLLVTANSLMGG